MKQILVVVYIRLLGQFQNFYFLFKIRFHKHKNALKSTKKHNQYIVFSREDFVNFKHINFCSG